MPPHIHGWDDQKALQHGTALSGVSRSKPASGLSFPAPRAELLAMHASARQPGLDYSSLGDAKMGM